ncbi:MAG: hypothetical protein HRT66_08225 [Flavobacteriaceae bacterium]|nr:hypothetical protein [Flavobacteriaceae bacterium]
MKTTPKHNISIERATDLLKDGQPLSDAYVSGELKIETDESWDKEVVIENCVIEYFSGSATQFKKPVIFINCQFKKCQFVFTYFLGGLTIDNCIFDNYLDFQAGGHNKIGCPVNITNNNFKSFVNFFDCWYENEVTICGNKFEKGTNLFGKPHNISVTFDKEPIVKDNTGRLDIDSER